MGRGLGAAADRLPYAGEVGPFGRNLVGRFLTDEVELLERDPADHFVLDLLGPVLARPLDIESVEIDHPFEIGGRAAAMDDHARDLAAPRDEGRSGRAEAAAVDDDAVAIDPLVPRQLVERLAIMANLGVVIELVAAR